jgi:hypothetical protein
MTNQIAIAMFLLNDQFSHKMYYNPEKAISYQFPINSVWHIPDLPSKAEFPGSRL